MRKVLLLFTLQCIPSWTKDTSFDVLILTQHWPYTTCIDWKERSKENSCRIPTQATWSLHGLWPTRLAEINPNFCDDSAKFDPSLLKPIMTEMETYWPDVEIRNRKDSLWQHEWVKYGTCAAQLPIMDSQLKYFKKGCELGKDNSISKWLEATSVLPGGEYDMKTVWEAVLAGTNGARPIIDCDYIKGEYFISEIKICYNKNLVRVHCDGNIKVDREVLFMGTCPHHKKLVYPSKEEGQMMGQTLVNVLGSIAFTQIGVSIAVIIIFKSYDMFNPWRTDEMRDNLTRRSGKGNIGDRSTKILIE